MSVEEASIRRAQEADIYVGIFGRRFSRTTVTEFREAWRNNKPCFVYLIDGGDRDERLQAFIDKEVRPVLKYQTEKDRSRLISRIKEDLILFAGEVLVGGVRTWVEKQHHKRLVPLKATSPASYAKRLHSRKQSVEESSLSPTLRTLFTLSNGRLSVEGISKRLGRTRAFTIRKLHSLLKRGLVLRVSRNDHSSDYELSTLGYDYLDRNMRS